MVLAQGPARLQTDCQPGSAHRKAQLGQPASTFQSHSQAVGQGLPFFPRDDSLGLLTAQHLASTGPSDPREKTINKNKKSAHGQNGSHSLL